MPVACVPGADDGQGVVTAKLKVTVGREASLQSVDSEFLDDLEEMLVFKKAPLHTV